MTKLIKWLKVILAIIGITYAIFGLIFFNYSDMTPYLWGRLIGLILVLVLAVNMIYRSLKSFI
jgi:hypothetical protein